MFVILKSDPFIHLYFNQTMIELINSRNVPDLFLCFHILLHLSAQYYCTWIEMYVYKP